MLYQTEASRAQKYEVWYLSDHTCVISNFSGLPSGLPASPSKKIVAKMGLVIIIYLEALSHIWGMRFCLIIIFPLIITLNLFRLLLLVFLLEGCYQECWNAGCQVCRFLLSKIASPHIKKVNLLGVSPFRDLTVLLSSSSCWHSGLLPWFCLLLILHHGSVLFTELYQRSSLKPVQEKRLFTVWRKPLFRSPVSSCVLICTGQYSPGQNYYGI